MSEEAPDLPDPQITITLPATNWYEVMLHLQQGKFADVAAIISSITEQANPQIEAAQKAALLRQARAGASGNTGETRTH